MSYKYRDEKIPKRPGSGGNDSRSFRGDVRRNSALNDSKRESGTTSSGSQSHRISYHDSEQTSGQSSSLSGITSEDAAAHGSRWDFVTVDELLFGYRRKNPFPDNRGIDDMLSKLVEMIADYQVNDEGRKAVFSEQAKFMESYEVKLSEDHRKNLGTRYTSRYHMFIGYQEMDLQELEDYFEWRTLLRRGEEPPFGTGFAALYASELITLNQEAKNKESNNKETKGIETTNQEAKDIESKCREANRIEAKDKDAKARESDKRSIFEELLALQAMVRKQAEEQRKQGYYSDRSEPERLDSIIRDYVLSWGPEPELVQAYCIKDMSSEAEMVTLSNVERTDDLSICRVLRNYTESRILNSKFFETAGEDAWRIIARVFRRICREQKSAGKESLAERILGRQTKYPHLLYALLPCKADLQEGYSIEVSPVRSYHVEKGIMQEYSYPAMQDEAALREMNELVRECERVLRKKFRYKNQLPNRLKDKKTEQLILQEADQWLKEKERRNRPEIHVDLSKLDAIRDQADLTRDRLLEGIPEGDGSALEDALNASIHDPASIVDGASTRDGDTITAKDRNTNAAGTAADDDDIVLVRDRDIDTEGALVNGNDVITAGIAAEGNDVITAGIAAEGNDVITAGIAAEGSDVITGVELHRPNMEQNAADESESIFDAKQREFLRLLLAGENVADYLQKLAVMPSVFVDAINETAFDEIGDSIVEEEGKSWRLVEDYIDDVREMLGID